MIIVVLTAIKIKMPMNYDGKMLSFYPSAIKAVGYSDHHRRAVGRLVRNSALTKKVTDEFCLFFTDMTHVLVQFIFLGTKP